MINIKSKFQEIEGYFSPKVIGEVNDTYVKLARIMGEDVPWHNHKDEDELFYIVEGTLLFEEEGKEPFMMNQGDLYIVKKGVNHRVSSTKECKIMLIEHKSTAHLGDVDSPIAKSIKEQLG